MHKSKSRFTKWGTYSGRGRRKASDYTASGNIRRMGGNSIGVSMPKSRLQNGGTF